MYLIDEQTALMAVRTRTLQQLVENLESSEVATVEMLTSRFMEFIANYGLTSVAALDLPSAGKVTLDCVLANTRPRIWMSEYLENDFTADDPVINRAPKQTKPYSWQDLLNGLSLAPREVRVLNHSADHGICEGFVVPIYHPGNRVGLVSMAGLRFDDTPATRSTLTLASVYYHHRVAALAPTSTAAPVILTTREREVLRWIASGKSDWQVGQILSVSQKTVNYHVENVKRKYQVATRIQAIVAALRDGTIDG